LTFEELRQLTEANAKAIEKLADTNRTIQQNMDNYNAMFQRDLLTLEQALVKLTQNVNRMVDSVAANAEATANLERQWQAYLTTLRKS
jgi:methyl-accepting chemotaxis protein